MSHPVIEQLERESTNRRGGQCLKVLLEDRDSKLPQRLKQQLLTRLLVWGGPYLWFRALTKVTSITQAQKIQLLERIFEVGDFGWCSVAVRHVRPLPPGFMERLAEAICASKKSCNSHWAWGILIGHPGLSESLKLKLRQRTWSLWRGTAQARRVIKSFFGQRWAVAPKTYAAQAFVKIDGGRVPLFASYQWEVIDTQKRVIAGKEVLSEALIGCDPRLFWQGRILLPEEGVIKVLLLRDAQGSYAHQVHPGVSNLKEAIAWFYGLNPETFTDFTKEV